MRTLSIRLRLTLWYAALLAITFTLLAAGITIALHHSIRTAVDRSLRSRLGALHRYIDQQKREGEEAHLPDELAEDADVLAAGALLRIQSTTKAWIYRARGTIEWEFSVPSRESLPVDGQIESRVVHDELIRILSAPIPLGVVQIGRPLSDFQDMQTLLAWTMFLGSPVLVLLAAAGGYWMSGRALRPVNEIATRARMIDVQNLSDSLPSRGTGDELDRLSETLNGMLARLKLSFARITQFTADASHELRTPVAIIRTTVEVAQAKPRRAEEQEKIWKVILVQTGRMADLIDDLLMLARTESEAPRLHPELMDAVTVVLDAVTEMQVLASASGLEMNVKVPQSCTMFGDPEDLRRIIVILLDNAIKYTQEGGKLFLEMKIEQSTQPPTVAISVRDTGVGISSAHLPLIFDRFYRAAEDRSRKTGGAGLGLTIARHLAERHEGHIEVESTPGKGSSFHLLLPIHQ